MVVSMPTLRFDNQGLIPAIVQHARSGEVLMLGYMNQQAIDQTIALGLVTFWSRSRKELWTKGTISGNSLRLVEIRTDCDSDALLVRAEPNGPTCHEGTRSCFTHSLSDADEAAHTEPTPPQAFLSALYDLLVQRNQERPEGSYTTYLLEKGVDKICKKIGEEAAEVIIAAKNGSAAELTAEMSDLVYHSLVLLVQQGVPPEAIWQELERRHK